MKKLFLLLAISMITATVYARLYAVMMDEDGDIRGIATLMAKNDIASSNWVHSVVFGAGGAGTNGTVAIYSESGLVDSGLKYTDILAYGTNTDNLVSYQMLQEWAVDSDAIWAGIYSNAVAIDAVGNGILDITASATDTNANGLALLTSVTNNNGTGVDNYYVLSEGIYNLPSTLTISGQVAHITCPTSPELLGKYLSLTLGKFPNSAYPPTKPMVSPTSIIAGNITIDPSAVGSEISGFKLTGAISAIGNTDADNQEPTMITDCWTTGKVADNEYSTINFRRVYAEDQVCGNTSGEWGGNAFDSIFLADGSFTYLNAGGSKSVTSWQISENCIFAGTGGMKNGPATGGGSGGKMLFINCWVNAENKFIKDVANSTFNMAAYYTQFWDANNDWEAMSPDNSANIFYYSWGFPSLMTNWTTSTFKYCVDESGNEF